MKIHKNSVKPTEIIKRLYVIVREDLAFKYVQGSHAVSQFALEHRGEFEQWNNETIIFLSVFNGLMLNDLSEKLKEDGFMFSAFIEPDLQSDLPTAIAIYESGSGLNGGKVAKALSKLKLATK